MPLLLLPKVTEKLLNVEHCLQLQKELMDGAANQSFSNNMTSLEI